MIILDRIRVHREAMRRHREKKEAEDLELEELKQRLYDAQLETVENQNQLMEDKKQLRRN